MGAKDKKGDGLEVWNLKVTGPAEDVPRGLVALGKGCGGTVMWVFVPRTGEGLLVHAMGKKPNETATASTVTDGRPPVAPKTAMDINAAVKQLQALQKGFPKEGPAVLRGSWSGRLVCDNGTPRVELHRKVVSYGVLKVVSTPGGKWSATFTREKKWFSDAAEQSVEKADLAGAIKAGMGLVFGLVAEACTVRDTTRRASRDTEYAASRPVRAPSRVLDPIGTYAAKREKIPAAKTIDAPTPCPTCPEGLVKSANVLVMNAGQLAKVETTNDVAEAPAQLARAGKLIARARVLLESPMCTGAEAKDGMAGVAAAEAAYEKARKAYTSGDDSGIHLAANLRRVAEQVALAAAKGARSCKAGQQLLPGVGGKAKAATPAAPKAAPKPRAPKGGGNDAKNQLIMATVKDSIRSMAAELRAGAM